MNSAFRLECVTCRRTVLSAWFAPKLPGAVTYSFSMAMSLCAIACAILLRRECPESKAVLWLDSATRVRVQLEQR